MTDDNSSKLSKSSRSSSSVSSPLHFTIHKPGFQLESCCGVCNLFPGVLITAGTHVFVGTWLLFLILSHGEEYDKIHLTQRSQGMSTLSGVVLSGVVGSGLLLLIVALTENCRAMMVYLIASILVLLSIVALSAIKISRGCARFGPTPRLKDLEHRMANLACVSGLFTFVGAVLYFFAFMVVLSFYHFRYVRRAIMIHEAECNLRNLKDCGDSNV